MNTQDILNLDYRKKENQEIIDKAIRRIKPFDKLKPGERITLEMLENVVGKYCRKYAVMMQYITPTFMRGEINYYSCSIKETMKHKWLGNVYAHTMYEVFAKVLIKIYSDVKSGSVVERDEEIDD